MLHPCPPPAPCPPLSSLGADAGASGPRSRHPKFLELSRFLLRYAEAPSFHGIVFARTRETVRSLASLVQASPDLEFVQVGAGAQGLESVGTRGFGGLAVALVLPLALRSLCPPLLLLLAPLWPDLSPFRCHTPPSFPFFPPGAPVHGARPGRRRRRRLGRHVHQGAAGGAGRVPPARPPRAPLHLRRRGGD